MATARRKFKAQGLSEMEIAERLMDIDIQSVSRLSPLLEQGSHDRLAGFTSKTKDREHVIWVMMDSGAANHVCDPLRHFFRIQGPHR